MREQNLPMHGLFPGSDRKVLVYGERLFVDAFAQPLASQKLKAIGADSPFGAGLVVAASHPRTAIVDCDTPDHSTVIAQLRDRFTAVLGIAKDPEAVRNVHHAFAQGTDPTEVIHTLKYITGIR